VYSIFSPDGPLVLLHLRDPGTLLGVLKRFLAPDGRLLVVEANDQLTALSQDPDGLFQQFLAIVRQDSFSGGRNFGAKTPMLLKEQGYSEIRLENGKISAAGWEHAKKQELFSIFSSYVHEDVRLLRQREPDNPQYAAWENWLDQYGAIPATACSGG